VPRLAHDAARDDSSVASFTETRAFTVRAFLLRFLTWFGENRPQLIRDGWRSNEMLLFGPAPSRIGPFERSTVMLLGPDDPEHLA
jgi:hypothetical protein